MSFPCKVQAIPSRQSSTSGTGPCFQESFGIIQTCCKGTAQLLEYLTQKPGTILVWVQIPGAARDFPPRVNFQCRLSCGVHTAPVCYHTHQHLCPCQKSQTLAAVLLSGHKKILYTLTALGSAALVAAVPYPLKATHISNKGQ